MVFKAVIFDIGGVVMRSPFHAIAQYEQEQGLPENYVNGLIVASGPNGAWETFERGELDLFSFYTQFTRDLRDLTNGNAWYTQYCKRKRIGVPKLPVTLALDGRELFGRMMRESNTYDPHIRLAIDHLRANGQYKLIALTNNFSRQFSNLPPDELAYLGRTSQSDELVRLFDDFCDSSLLGMRKPEARIYLLACERNAIKPEEAIFLDDIGMNLKTARDLGMETIHVQLGNTRDAVLKLEKKLGTDLTGPVGKSNSKL